MFHENITYEESDNIIHMNKRNITMTNYRTQSHCSSPYNFNIVFEKVVRWLPFVVLHISGYTLFDFMYFNPINISERFFTSARVGDAIMLTSPFLLGVSPHVFGVPLSRRPYLVG